MVFGHVFVFSGDCAGRGDQNESKHGCGLDTGGGESSRARRMVGQ